MANERIFWVGGTGANVALAFSRLQRMGFIENANDITHYFIDTRDQIKQNGEAHPKHIALNAFQAFGMKNYRILPTTEASYSDFQELLHTKPALKNFFEGKELKEEGKPTDITFGNYYRPAIAAATAHTNEFSNQHELSSITQAKTIICASAYGGTGAGVLPFLVKHLLNNNNEVIVLYLNYWLMDTKKKERIESNCSANKLFFENLKKTHSFASKLTYFFFDVPHGTDGWQETTANLFCNSNIFCEHPNPYPYYVAARIATLLKDPDATEHKKGGVYKVELNPNRLGKNNIFIYAYIYSQITKAEQFKFVRQLAAKIKWKLAKLHWSKEIYDYLKAYIENGHQNKSGIETNFTLMYEGFEASEQNEKNSDNHNIISYPSVFPGYHYFQERLNSEQSVKNAYLALIALVVTKRVYPEYDKLVEELSYKDEIGVIPIALKDHNKVIGYTTSKPLYVWPHYHHISTLSEMLSTDDNIKAALFKLYSIIKSDNTFSSEPKSLKQLLEKWCTENKSVENNHSRRSGVNVEFLKEYVPSRGTIRSDYQVNNVTYDKAADKFNFVTTEGEIFDQIKGSDHNLFLIGNNTTGKKILQYTNVLPKNRNDNIEKDRRLPIVDHEGKASDSRERSTMAINYCTVFTFSKGITIEVLHPSHIFSNQTFIFEKDNTPVVPWPIRKDYLECLVRTQLWSEGDFSSPRPSDNQKQINMLQYKINCWHSSSSESLSEYSKEEENEASFTIPIYDKPKDITYQGLVWPCDAETKRFASNWTYYSICVTSSPQEKPLGAIINKEKTETENWFFSYEDASKDILWGSLNQKDGPLFTGTRKGSPPTGILIEINSSGECYSAYFPMKPSVKVTLPPGNQTAKLGLDFGTSNTCTSIRINNASHVIGIDPDALIYSVFNTQSWQYTSEKNKNPGWIPYFRNTEGFQLGIIPTGLMVIDRTKWDQAKDNFVVDSGGGGFRFYLDGQDVEEINALEDASIPGIDMGGNDNLIKNLKWYPQQTERVFLWKNFLEIYLLFIAAHLYLRRKDNRIDSFQIHYTFPLKFEKELYMAIPGRSTTPSMAKVYGSLLESVARKVSDMSNLALSAGAPISESTAPLSAIGTLNHKVLFIMVDIGGGTTDVSIIKGGKCLAASSFRFAGNNPVFAGFDPSRSTSAEIFNSIKSTTTQPYINNFITTMEAYTALLIGAVIKQHTRDDAVPTKIQVHLLGQAWHLAQYRENAGREKGDSSYQQIIENHIKHIFTSSVAPSLELQPDDIELDIHIPEDVFTAKKRCSEGALQGGGAIKVDESGKTFNGVSYKNGAIEFDWWQSSSQAITEKKGVQIDPYPSCPALIVSDNKLIQDVCNTNINIGSVIEENLLEKILEEVGKPKEGIAHFNIEPLSEQIKGNQILEN